MIKKQQIETQLDCRATASLRNEIVEDLSKPDKPISTVLEVKDKDESENNNEQGD